VELSTFRTGFVAPFGPDTIADAELEVWVIVLLAVSDVKAPVVGVVAPTVPLMLIDAVPVRFVTVPLEGVPNTPPLTTNAPALPVLTPSAVATPVPGVVVASALKDTLFVLVHVTIPVAASVQSWLKDTGA
jgi:hypothetical protein